MDKIESEAIDSLARIAVSNYVAQKAIIFYELDMVVTAHDKYHYSNTFPARNVKNFVTVHNIRDGEVCEGQPITRSVLEEMVKQLVPSVSRPAFIPENVIMMQSGIGMAWWTKSGVRKLYFDDETKIKSGEAPVPALLFLVRDGNFYVWALENNKRPMPRDAVYHAPFFNLTNGLMCTGNVQVPDRIDVDDIPVWQRVMFQSRFTNHGAPCLKGITGKGLWDSLIGKGIKEFPLQHLVKAGTVGSVLGQEEE